jgi:hypothetical protein
MKLCLFLPALLFLPVWAEGGEAEAVARTKKELLPRLCTLKAEALPIDEALTKLFELTGNRVVDRRQQKTPAAVKIDEQGAGFWQALDALARAAGCAISTYQADGKIALVDGPVRPRDTIYQGIFRIVAKRVNVSRDDDAGTHVCTITLEIAWEPRYEPLYLEVGPVEAIFAADAKGLELKAQAPGQGKYNVAGRNALEVDIHLPAPARSSAKIKSLAGQFQLTGPGKMLTFAFAKLPAAEENLQEGVKVSVSNLKTASKRWSMDVHIENPPGPLFESYQSWLGNNRIALEKTSGSERQVWQPRPGDSLEIKRTATQAIINYNFHVAAGEHPGSPADWKLTYRTPGRIVDLEVPFAFKDIPLP